MSLGKLIVMLKLPQRRRGEEKIEEESRKLVNSFMNVEKGMASRRYRQTNLGLKGDLRLKRMASNEVKRGK